MWGGVCCVWISVVWLYACMCVFPLEFYPPYTAKLQLSTCSIKKSYHRCFIGIGVSSFHPLGVLHWHSGNNHPELLSHCTGSGQSPLQNCPFSRYQPHLGDPKTTHSFERLAIHSEYPTIILCKELTELREALSLLLQVYDKGHTQSEIWEGPGSRASVPSSGGVRASNPPSTSVCSPNAKLHRVSGSVIFKGASVYRCNWWDHWPQDWSQSLSARPLLVFDHSDLIVK